MVSALRGLGYNVLDIKEERLFGINDKEVFKKAQSDKRIILTHDKDFINLAEKFINKDCGVIVIRYNDKSPANVINRFVSLLDHNLKNKLFGSLIIINEDTTKISPTKE